MKKIVLSAALVAIGTFAMAQQQMGKMMKKDPAQMEQRKAEHMKKMQMELGLSTAQGAKINAYKNKKMAEKQPVHDARIQNGQNTLQI